MDKLTAENYAENHHNAVRTAVFLYRMLREMPLQELLERIDRAESVGPFDERLWRNKWRDKHVALRQDGDMIRALLNFQRAVDEVLNNGQAPSR